MPFLILQYTLIWTVLYPHMHLFSEKIKIWPLDIVPEYHIKRLISDIQFQENENLAQYSFFF